jgi:hypothetical protein
VKSGVEREQSGDLRTLIEDLKQLRIREAVKSEEYERRISTLKDTLDQTTKDLEGLRHKVSAFQTQEWNPKLPDWNRPSARRPQLDATTHPTAVQPAPENLVLQLYQVLDLRDPESLVRVIKATIHPETWTERGGPATIVFFPEGKSLVVKQSAEAHKEIRDLLSILRKAMQEAKALDEAK